MSQVFVLDTMQQPLDPVHPAWARKLLSRGQAAVFRHYPFTIILGREVESPVVHPLRIKLDPGSKTTGIAVVNDASGQVVWAGELSHRGQAIKKALDARRMRRRSRRQRKTRYRKPRFRNRRRKSGWLPPSLESRLANVMTWATRLMHMCPIQASSVELVKFDTQLMQNPEIEKMEYQQGTLAGYELREYLLEKWERRCAYCGVSGVPLQIEHILCRTRGGTHCPSNLTLACEPCNVAKGTQLIEDFLQDQPAVLAHILAQAKAPLKDAAAVNTLRWALYECLQTLGVPVECGTGGRTKFNRLRQDLPKAHWIDAACVGASSPETLDISRVHLLRIIATGTGCRQMCRMDRYGFPRTRSKQAKRVKGFQTGDLVRAVVSTGKKVGTYVGKVAVRATGSFNILTQTGTIQGVNYKYCRLLQRCDGYTYQSKKGGSGIPPTAQPVGILPHIS